ncbi:MULTISPECIES: FecR family protein [Thalassospira]|uniref:FecR family protein n=1 Tax=Thalassospira TaxID=168934 RepID=UPI001D190564|nr:FecR domain-containing protein [Thalassospira povalilytica]MCC4240020.1 FecR domain-containing protein [Thalassospira povalilytica]
MTRFPNPDSGFQTRTEQAAYWFALLLDGSETEEDRRAFASWIEKDPRNMTAFNEVERLWSGSSSLHLAANNKVGRRAFLGGTVVAGILATGWGVQRYHPAADFRTATGERRELTLPGGMRALLASGTTMSLVSGQGLAGVELHEGEVWFDHSKGNRDFFVAASGARSWSRGGSFDVARYDDQTTVTVEQGSVAVKLADQARLVSGGQAVTYHDGKMGAVHDVNIANALAWRDGRLVFVGDKLGDVARILERWQSGKIIVIGDHVASRKVTMSVDLDRTRDVLPTLAGALSLKIDQFTDYLTVIRAA